MMITLSCIYALIMGVFTILFFVDWIRKYQKVKKFLWVGVFLGVIIVGINFIALVISPSSSIYSIFFSVFTLLIILIRIIGFTMLGMQYAYELKIPSFPFLLLKTKLFRKQITLNLTEEPRIHQEPSETFIENQIDFFNDRVSNEPLIEVGEETEALDFQSIDWKRSLISVVLISCVGIIYSVSLFLVTKPHISNLIQERMNIVSVDSIEIFGLENMFTAVIIAVLAAISEELFFRLGIQNFLIKYLNLNGNWSWVAILLTTSLWTLGHVGTLEPEWVKLAQVFPVGLGLGWISKKYGVESSMLTHLIFNLVLVSFSQFLIQFG